MNDFKPYNDQFGYWQGDKMIRLLASVIVQECDSQARELDYIQAEDRLGNPTRFPLTTLSIGAVRIAPGDFDRPEDVASAAASAKHYAKKSNAGLFVHGNKNLAVARHQHMTISARRSALA